MNANEFIENRGIKTIPNPNYNPKSKKNKGPRTLDVIDLSADKSQLNDIVAQDLLDQDRVSVKEASKYEEYGLNWNREEASNGSLDIQLADAQSNWSKAFNAIAQTVVSEIGLGTAIAITDIFDAIGQAVGASDHDYNNPVSTKLEEWQEAFKNNVAPIYSKPGSGFENGTDFGWWMQNIPSIASSLTLLIPTNLAVGAVKGIGKAIRGGSKIASTTRRASKWAAAGEKLDRAESVNSFRNFIGRSDVVEGAKLFTENGVKAAMMRTMENYQEARQVYDDMYADVKNYLTNASDEEKQAFVNRNANLLKDENIDINDIDSVAKAVAKKSADETFKLDYLNTGFDLLELYALKNIPFHGFRNVRTNATTRRLNKNAIKYAGQYKSVDELKELLNKRPLRTKIGEGIGDFFVGSRLAIGAQLSEGVEEAVNYIAQQEGMNLGHTMLGMEVDNVFSNRLNSYLKNGQLWESAFWGLAGGITFQAAGSGLNRVSTAIERYNDYKDRKVNAKTKEEIKRPTWTSLWEQADKKRDEAELKVRIENEQEYLRKVHAIKKGQNPYDPDYKESDAQGSLTEEEQKPFLDYANKQRITSMALNAMDAGRMNQLQAYLESEEVRDAMKEQLGLTDEQAEDIRQEGLRIFEEVQQRYDNNVRRINRLSRYISDKVDIPYIPTEYIQLIARENIDKELQAEELEKQIAAVELTVKDLSQDVQSKVDPIVNNTAKTQIRLDLLSTTLGRLNAYKRNLQIDTDRMNTVAGQQELARVNKQIESIKDSIRELQPENAISNLLYAITAASNTTLENGQYKSDSRNVTDEYKNIRSLINTKDIAKLKQIDKRLVDITEADLQHLSVIEDTALRTHTSESGLKIVSPDLFNEYVNLAGLQEQLKNLRQDMVVTPDDLANEVNELHNWMNEARSNAVLNARKTFINLLDTYTPEQLHKVLENRVNGVDDFNSINNISERDKTTIKNALDILNLRTLNNVKLAEWLDEEINTQANVRAAERKNSSTSQNPISEEQNPNLNDKPQTDEKLNIEAETGQIEPTSVETSEPPVEEENSTITLNYEDKPYATLTPTNNNVINEYVLSLVEENGTNKFSDSGTLMLNNPDLFIKDDGVSLTDDPNTWYISENPIVKYNKNTGNMEVLAKGRISKTTTQNVADTERDNNAKATEEAQEVKEVQTQSTQESILPTGVVDSNQPANVQSPTNPETISDEIADKIQDIIAEETDNIFTRKQPILTDEDIETIRTRLINAFGDIDKNGVIVEFINNSLNTMKNQFEAYGGYVPVITAARDARLLDSNPNNSTILEHFQTAINSIIDAHRLEFGFDNVDNKTYVHVETLLKYCNKVTDNPATAKRLFNQVYKYLSSSDKYVVVDESKDKILPNVNNVTSIVATNNRPSSINFDGVLQETLPNSPDERRLLDVINSLQIGQPIDFKYTKNSIEFSSNSVLIGRIYVPYKYRKNTDHLIQDNDGWLTDVKITANSVESELRDLFISWIENPNNDKDITELYNTILQFAFTHKNDKATRTKLLKAFVTNPEVIKAKQDGFINNAEPSEDVLEGIAKLWRYIQIRNNTSLGRLARVDSINDWFNIKVRDGINLALTLARQGEGQVKIADITEGVRAVAIPETEKNINSDDPRLTTPTIGLSDRFKVNGKVDTSKVKVVTTQAIPGKGVINHVDNTVSTKDMSIDSRLRTGSTGVILVERNGEHDYVHAYPQRTNSSRLSPDAKKISKAIINHCRNLVVKWAEADNDVEKENIVRELHTFLSKILPDLNNKTVTPFLKGATGYYNVRISDIYDNGNNKDNWKGTGEYLGFEITVMKNGKAETYSFKFKYNSTVNNRTTYPKKFSVGVSKDGKTSDIKTVDEIVNLIADTINNECAFNLGHDFIELDNNSAVSDTGIVSKDPNTGKIHIKVGDILDLTYDSFNQFVLDNNIVALNIQTTEGGRNNFVRNPENGVNRQTVSIENVTSSSNLNGSTTPVRENVSTSTTSTFNPTIDSEAINKVINSKNKNKGLAIAKLLLGNDKNADKFKQLLFKKIVLDVFPKNVIFVNENIGVIATSNPYNNPLPLNNGTNIVLQPGQVVVGKEWLDIVNSGELGRHSATRLLIHENLHILLNTPGNEQYVERIRSIYDEFVAKNDDSNLEPYYLTQFDDYVTDGKLNNVGLEEFLVYSLTDNNLSQKLNEIKTDEEFKDKTKKSLLQKIMEFVLQLFDWKDNNGNQIEVKIQDGSLYEKEFKLLGNIFTSTKPKSKKAKPEVVNINQTSLDFTEEQYITETNQEESNNYENEDLGDLGLTDARISDVLPYTTEMLDIRAKAIAYGTFMKAPNGKPTNLTERQWLQVRTKAFKDWFGDWESVAARIANAKVIWGHPGIGKTEYYKNNNNVIDFDSVYKPRINKELGLPEGAEERKKWRREHRDEYKQKILSLFDEAVEDAKKQGKQLLVSDMVVLQEREDALDLITQMSEDTFAKRSAQRNEPYDNNKKLWKTDIDEGIAKVSDKSKVVNTEKYLSELYEEAKNISKVVDENGEPLVVFHGSDNKFNIFDVNNRNQTSLSKEIGKKYFFSSEKSVAKYFVRDNEINTLYIISNELNNIEPGDDETSVWNYIGSIINKTGEEAKQIWFDAIRTGKVEYGDVVVKPDTDGKFYEVFLNIKNPLILNAKGERADIFINNNKEEIKEADSIIIKNIDETVGDRIGVDYIVSNPNQIKSATDDTGEFSKTDDTIYSIAINSVDDFLSKFPVEDRNNIKESIDNGELSLSCK